jgi:hypothetical protein
MYSCLNVLVNEINALGVKNITDLNINRKILQSLSKPDYDLVNVVWTSLGPLPRWVPGPTTRWAPGTTRLALHGT